MSAAALEVENLSVSYGRAPALRDVSLRIDAGTITGVVGESGCGKSTLILAILGLLPPGGVRTGGRIAVDGVELTALSPASLNRLRGDRVSVVFQDPMAALSPVLSIGTQMTDIQYRRPGSAATKRRRAADMLGRVRVSDPELRLRQFAHEFSGGMLQRVTIAMAVLAQPALLIADEPTTALDATLEVEIIDLLRELQQEVGCAIMLVSHHLGLIAELSRDVVVMYAGEAVEHGPIGAVFDDPRHPYTRRLIDCDPARITDRTRLLPTIPGELPNLLALPPGCIFAPRCDRRWALCVAERPALFHAGSDRDARCFLVPEGRRP
jgi:peptide/nickel transport system ATP-binding protein